LAKYHAKPLLIGCTAWFDNNVSPHGWKICKNTSSPLPPILPNLTSVLQTGKNLKRRGAINISSTWPIQKTIAYSISCSKVEKKIDLLQDVDKN
jgi:hypothetical protein